MSERKGQVAVVSSEGSKPNDFLDSLKALLETPAQKGGLTTRILAFQVYHENDFPVVGPEKTGATKK